jgi:hypothetical protein
MFWSYMQLQYILELCMTLDYYTTIMIYVWCGKDVTTQMLARNPLAVGLNFGKASFSQSMYSSTVA